MSETCDGDEKYEHDLEYYYKLGCDNILELIIAQSNIFICATGNKYLLNGLLKDYLSLFQILFLEMFELKMDAKDIVTKMKSKKIWKQLKPFRDTIKAVNHEDDKEVLLLA